MNTSCCTPPSASTATEPTLRKPRYSTNGDDHAVIVKVELPGVSKDSISIDYDKQVLTIKGERKTAVPEAWKPLYRELDELGYALRLRLNSDIDEDKLKAQFADGILTVTLPIREAAKPRRIEVN